MPAATRTLLFVARPQQLFDSVQVVLDLPLKLLHHVAKDKPSTNPPPPELRSAQLSLAGVPLPHVEVKLLVMRHDFPKSLLPLSSPPHAAMSVAVRIVSVNSIV